MVELELLLLVVLLEAHLLLDQSWLLEEVEVLEVLLLLKTERAEVLVVEECPLVVQVVLA
jgi:hypothetical protein